MTTEYRVIRDGKRWAVVRMANSVNGTLVCRHRTRQAARDCVWWRNGRDTLESDGCARLDMSLPQPCLEEQ